MGYVIAGTAVLFVLLCIAMASFAVSGRRQTFEEAMKWQSDQGAVDTL